MSGVFVAAEFPDMLAGIDPQVRPLAARASAAGVLHVRPGAWSPDEAGDDRHGHFGLLVVDGLLARRVHLGRRVCVELLGGGDLLRPWASATDGSSIAIDARWIVQEETRIAVLDRGFAMRVARYPEIAAWLLDRAIRRAHWLAFHLVVCHLPQLQTRLRVMFWYLADRWGRVTPEGVVVPLQMTHNLIGSLVGARRPATTSAMGELATQGWIERRDDGAWVLHGERPAELEAAQAEAQGLAVVTAR